jgi:hypothetical protein
MDTPNNYAKAIAYIGDASTIRARTADMFGRHIPLATCQRFIDERQAGKDLFRRTSHRRAALRASA